MKLDKNILKLINEVYNEFDFLNNDEMIEENKIKSLLNEKFFQKQFIVDSISYIDEKIEVNDIDFTMKENENEVLIGYSCDIEYEFNNEKLNFILNIGKLSLFETEVYKNKKNLLLENINERFIDWNNLPVKMITKNGDIIELEELYNEPKEIRIEFFKSYMGEFLETGDLNNGEKSYNSPPLY